MFGNLEELGIELSNTPFANGQNWMRDSSNWKTEGRNSTQKASYLAAVSTEKYSDCVPLLLSSFWTDECSQSLWRETEWAVSLEATESNGSFLIWNHVSICVVLIESPPRLSIFVVLIESPTGLSVFVVLIESPMWCSEYLVKINSHHSNFSEKNKKKSILVGTSRILVGTSPKRH